MSKWEWKKLGEVFDFSRGLTYSKKDEVEISSNCILRSNNIDLQTNSINLDELKYIKDEIDIPPEKYVRMNTILICMSNGSKAHLGKVAYIDQDYDYAFGGFMGLLRPKCEINGRFVHFYLCSENYKEFIKSLSDGANINNLKFDDLKEFEIPVPPLSEQNRIVKFLDNEFSKIETLKTNAETNLKNSRELFNVELEKSFLGKNGWKTVRLGDCGKLKNGMNFTASDSGYTIHSLGVGDFKNLYQINDTKVLSKISLNAPPPEDYLLKDGDIVFVRSNGNKELVGRCVLVYPRKTPTTYSGFCIRFRKEFEQLDSDFLLHFMKSDNSRKILNGKEGANISNLNQKILGDFQIPLPPLSVQKEIVARLDKLSENVKRLEANYKQIIANCDELKKSILKKTFEGDSRSSRE